jgi:hypothetical protein
MSSAIKLVDFGWWFPLHGHKWVRGQNSEDARLIPKRWSRRRGTLGETPAQMYRPNPGLFREFARINPTSHFEICAFADKYGDILVVPGDVRGRAESGKPIGRKNGMPIWKSGVPIRKSALDQTWRTQIKLMRAAVDHWDRLKSTPWQVKDALSDTETPRCALAYPIEVGIRLFPSNLLAFMWLTFARVVSGEVEERRCAGFDADGLPCPKYLYIGKGPGLRRDDREATCGLLCRKRKQRASGMSQSKH